MATFFCEALAWPRKRDRQAKHADDFTTKSAQPLSVASSGPAALKAVPANRRASRAFTVAAGAEAEQLTLAFLRYIELHGHALAGPRSRCSLATVRGQGTETKIFTFWSPRAAAGFDVFWRRYRPIYGAPGETPAPEKPGRRGAKVRAGARRN